MCPCREEEPNWDQDIAGDVKDECSKYGAVGHVHVDRNSKVTTVSWRAAYLTINAAVSCKAASDGLKFVLQGHVYLKFLRPEGASAAQKSLNGRRFAGRQISADFQFPAVYNNHFKC